MTSWIYFGAGMVAGGIAGYYICKKKYNIVKLEDVEQVEMTLKPETICKDKQKEEYTDEIFSASYAQSVIEGDDEWDEADKINPIEPTMVPYVISPEGFANEHSDFAKLTMIYYEENEVLVNEEEECVDIDSTIGYDAINHFGEYEKDAVFIRNEALGNDYEVLLEHTSFNGGD
jgi:hypothetical protein